MGYGVKYKAGVFTRSLSTRAGNPDHPVTSGQQLLTQGQANALAVPNDGYRPHALPFWVKGHQLRLDFGGLGGHCVAFGAVNRAEPVRLSQQPCVLLPELLHGILLEHSEHDLTTGIRAGGSGQKESRPGIPERLSIGAGQPQILLLVGRASRILHGSTDLLGNSLNLAFDANHLRWLVGGIGSDGHAFVDGTNTLGVVLHLDGAGGYQA